jgi:hypothetical protein
MAPATLKSISRGEAPPFDAATAKKECAIPSDQQTLLKSTPGWTNQKKTVRALGCARVHPCLRDSNARVLTLNRRSSRAIAARSD